MREKDLKETGLADMAYKVDKDHEVQMARGDLYKIAKYGIKLHEMLKGVSEEQGLDGWVQAKITKAADYLGSVYHHLDYEMKFDEVTESKKEDVKEAAPKKMKVTDADKKAGTEARSSASDQAAKAGAYNGGKSLAGKGDGKAHLAHKLKGDALQKHRDAGVAKMDAEDKAARKAQADKFAAMKGEGYKKLPERGERAKKNKKVKEGGSYEDTLFAKLAEANSKKK